MSIDSDIVLLMEANFAAIPGQPTLAFAHRTLPSSVQICATPLLGMDPVRPQSLNFVAVVARLDGDKIEVDDAREALQDTLKLFDMGALAAGPEDEEGARLFECFIAVFDDAEHESMKRCVISVPVSEHIYQLNLQLVQAQQAALARIATTKPGPSLALASMTMSGTRH
jgi:hypothetical protein